MIKFPVRFVAENDGSVYILDAQNNELGTTEINALGTENEELRSLLKEVVDFLNYVPGVHPSRLIGRINEALK